MKITQSAKEATQHAVEVLSWKSAQRDDDAVARQIYEGGEIDSMHALGSTTLVDELFYFINETLGLLGKWEKICPSSIKRVMVPFIHFIMIYLIKIVYGICYMEPIADLIFTNQALMKLVGFNATQIKDGVCKRGDCKRKHKEKTGPICVDALSNNLVKLSVKTVEALFNQAIVALATFGSFPSKIVGIIDTSLLETTKSFQGCGKTSREKEVRDKNGQKTTIKVEMFGFKVAVLVCAKTMIPIAVKVAKIEVSDHWFLRQLVEQGIKNIGSNGKIYRILIDRGFLDGEDLWWLHKEKGIEFAIPAKENMSIVTDIKGLALEKGEEIHIASRTEGIRRMGEDGKSKVCEGETECIGVNGLVSYDAYGPEGHEKDKNKKDFRPNPINAVWVKKWAGRVTANGGPVYLTNIEIKNPMWIVDCYRDRSLIENGTFRTGKQHWSLTHPPKRTAKGMKIHIIFTMMVIALTTAFRNYKTKEEKAEQKGKETGIARYRRKIYAEGQDKVIVFHENKYGIFYMYEVLVLMGRTVKDLTKLMGTDYKMQILKKYNLYKIESG